MKKERLKDHYLLFWVSSIKSGLSLKNSLYPSSILKVLPTFYFRTSDVLDLVMGLIGWFDEVASGRRRRRMSRLRYVSYDGESTEAFELTERRYEEVEVALCLRRTVD